MMQLKRRSSTVQTGAQVAAAARVAAPIYTAPKAPASPRPGGGMRRRGLGVQAR